LEEKVERVEGKLKKDEGYSFFGTQLKDGVRT
jgi:hypothetical protein